MTSHNSETTWAPGTVVLGDALHNGTTLDLHPIPSSDPNDPLNWSRARKYINFALTCFYVLMTFVLQDIGGVAYEEYVQDINLTYALYNDWTALGYTGLAIGGIMFIPLVYKYGRRPLYLISLVLQLATAIWAANLKSSGSFLANSLIMALGGAISETIVQITIADLFFIHQRAKMNGIFLLMQSIGAYLGPVASGYIVQSQGWRWMWWWCAILLGVNLLLVLCFFEETKYTPILSGQALNTNFDHPEPVEIVKSNDKSNVLLTGQQQALDEVSELERSVRPKPYRQRLALYTPTPGPIHHHFYQPFILLVTFPAVAFTAITYGALLAWFTVIISVESVYLTYPPYNFSSAGVGLFSLAPFIGSLIASCVRAPFNDWSIVWLSKRNGGIYEPEMRLWTAIPAAFVAFAGILLFGVGLDAGMSWPVLAVGWALYAFGFVVMADVSLTYLTDCYQNIVGDALVAVVFVRNAVSVLMMYVLTPWLDALGVRNLFICVAFLALLISLAPVPFLIWGKRARVASASDYIRYMQRDGLNRVA